jgi:nucleoside 2-deoxyribosyltransferase
MKIYVAASWLSRERARVLMTQLEAEDHTITFDWTACVPSDDRATRAIQAKRDLQGVADADALVLLVDENPTQGAWVEFGYAIALSVPIIALLESSCGCIFLDAPSDVFAARNRVQMLALLKELT